MENNELKKIPYALTKNQFVRYCFPVPESKVRTRLNEIIFECRRGLPENKGKDKKEIIRTHLVEKKEIVEYFETYGLPKGYEL